MYLVVGLGNPGRQYDGTRHNVGFEAIELLAHRHRFPSSKSTMGAQVSRGQIGDETVLLTQPMTFMNLSGDPVGNIMRYYRCEASDVIVVHDDLDFEPGEVRVKVGGGHGGHNGLRSIFGHIGREFPRVRIGVGKPPSSWDGADWVLSRPDANARRGLDDAIERAADGVETILKLGSAKAMARFNQKPKKAKRDKETEDTSVDSDIH